MGNIIASQLNLNADQSFTGAVIFCALALLSACGTYALFKNGFKQGFHSDDVVMGVCTIGFTLLLIIGAYSIIDRSQTQQNEYNAVEQATSKVPYYNLTKDGVLIVAEKKSDAPDWLTDKVETKIISEDKVTSRNTVTALFCARFGHSLSKTPKHIKPIVKQFPTQFSCRHIRKTRKETSC